MEGLLKNSIVLSLGLCMFWNFTCFCMFLQFQFVCMDPFVDFVYLWLYWWDFGSIFAIMQGESFRDHIRSSWECLVDVKRYAVTAKLHCIRIDIWMQWFDYFYFFQMTFSIFDTNSVQELCAGEDEHMAGLAQGINSDLDRLLTNVQLMVP